MDLRLLDRYFTGSNCSPAELQEIKQYLEHPDHLLEEYLSGEWRQAGGLVNEDRKQKNLRRIMAATAQLPVQEIRPRRWKGYWAAAAILGIVLLGSLIINKNRIDHTSTIVASKITWKTMRNGSDNVQLITLPEGSRVWLNSRTAISYPADYGARNKREIHLSGEAYFDVMHDARRPFIIHTDSLQTTVLGTSFAIRAWPHTPYIQVALVKGSVRVTGYNGTLKETLVPGDLLTFTKTEQTMAKIANGVGEDRYKWTEGKIVLSNTRMTEALEQLEQLYGVTIRYDNRQTDNRKLTGKFNREGFDIVLQNLLFAADMTYTKKDGIYYISQQQK